MEQTVQTETTQPEVTQPSMPTSALMTTLMALVENYIKDIVSAQVIEIMTNHQAMRVIDDGFENKIREIAQDVAESVVSDHTDGEYHVSEDDIRDIASTEVNDFDFDDKVSDAVTSAIDQLDFEDIVRTAIKDNITFSVSVD
jgi:hypothetical protein